MVTRVYLTDDLNTLIEMLLIFLQQAAKDYVGIEADDESTMYEDSVAPSKSVDCYLCYIIGL